jgi:hypothetical protein
VAPATRPGAIGHRSSPRPRRGSRRLRSLRRATGVVCCCRATRGGAGSAGKELAAVGQRQEFVPHRRAARSRQGLVERPPGTRRLAPLPPAGRHAVHFCRAFPSDFQGKYARSKAGEPPCIPTKRRSTGGFPDVLSLIRVRGHPAARRRGHVTRPPAPRVPPPERPRGRPRSAPPRPPADTSRGRRCPAGSRPPRSRTRHMTVT